MVLLDEEALVGAQRNAVGLLEVVWHFLLLNEDDGLRLEEIFRRRVRLHFRGSLLFHFFYLGEGVGFDGSWGWLEGSS